MTPAQYCQQKVAPLGSSLYYSTLFLPQAKRQVIFALHAFSREIMDVVFECSEPQIAMTKLQWWQQEVTKMYAGTSEHPVGQVLIPSIQQYALPQELFLGVLSGAEQHLTTAQFQTFDDWVLHCHHTTSLIFMLTCYVLTPTPITLTFARDFGVVIQLIHNICDLRKDLSAGQNNIALTDLERFHLTEKDLQQYKQSENLQKLLQEYTDKARLMYQQALSHLSGENRKELRSFLILAKIEFALLKEVEQEGFQVLQQRTSLTALRKLWLAWCGKWRQTGEVRVN